MKRIAFILFCLIGFLKVANAQNFETDKAKINELQGKKSFYFKTNPFAILAGPITLTAEYRLGVEATATPRISYQICGGYLNKSFFFNLTQNDTANGLNAKDFSFQGFRIQGQVRYYFKKFEDKKDWSTKFTPSGYYIAAHGSYSTATLRLKTQAYPYNDYININANVLIGLQAMIEQSFGIDFYTGVGWKQNSLTSVDYRLRKTNLNLTESGFSQYYASHFKISFGMNFTFGLF